MNLYYFIWVDAIHKYKSNPTFSMFWKFYAMIAVSMAMALNLWFITFVLMVHFNITSTLFPITIDLFPGTKVDAFFSFFISYLLPMLLLNYFLIFHRSRYLKLIQIYKPQDGKLFGKYFLGTFLALILYFFIAFLFIKVF